MAQLLNTFAAYKELISYSNANFYRGKLQVMKIRGRTSMTYSDSRSCPVFERTPRKNRNLNQQEAEFIISELVKLKERGARSASVLSRRILTTETSGRQDRKAARARIPVQRVPAEDHDVRYLPGRGARPRFLLDGANSESDKLWGVFIKDLASVDLEEDGKLKAQRLNVGFSRAKECVHFVLSKPVDGYSGAIGESITAFLECLCRSEERTRRLPKSIPDRSGKQRS